ncbi:hypothetical protein ACO2Q8_26010 [Larkinella sp. VNQ87]|uniref:hypothetical protein n=1 Tax=Larkinella sp. VNQ87 TaxID=3400921 RepID=UPI003C04D1F3
MGTANVCAQEARATNTPSKTYSRTPLAEGPTVVGTFEGRFPCAEIYRDWKMPVRPECVKLKWGLTLFQDPATHQPTTYRLNRNTREGTWAIVRGTKTDPNAVVYQLDSDKPEVSIYLLKGDDNVLFVLDQERNFRVGNDYLSYTLNRVVN